MSRLAQSYCYSMALTPINISFLHGIGATLYCMLCAMIQDSIVGTLSTKLKEKIEVLVGL